MKTNIAENIKFYRKQLHLTQGQLAEKLNGKASLVSNYKNGYITLILSLYVSLPKYLIYHLTN